MDHSQMQMKFDEGFLDGNELARQQRNAATQEAIGNVLMLSDNAFNCLRKTRSLAEQNLHNSTIISR